MDKTNKETESFKPCGQGDNTCNCKNASECGYSTNKTPLEELALKYYPKVDMSKITDGTDYSEGERAAFKKGYFAGHSSIKQEQKPSEAEIEKAARAYIKTLPALNYKSAYDFGAQNMEAFKRGIDWILSTFASPSKEIDKTLAIEFAEWLPQNAAIAEDEYYWISLKDGKTISASGLYDIFLSQRPK